MSFLKHLIESIFARAIREGNLGTAAKAFAPAPKVEEPKREAKEKSEKARCWWRVVNGPHAGMRALAHTKSEARAEIKRDVRLAGKGPRTLPPLRRLPVGTEIERLA